MSKLSSIETMRYARHFSLPEIGPNGQLTLKNAKVLCVGAGGLGATALYYLAAAGIGTLGIVDPDTVSLSNLQRQILYTTDDVGLFKVDAAQQRLLQLNPHCDIVIYKEALDETNALSLVADYDVVIDASDNFYTRYVINDACCSLQKPDVFAGIFRFQGQCSVFGVANSPCYRCLYPNAPENDASQNCAQAGVLGVLPGLLGCVQANETIKLLLGIGAPLIGRIMQFNALNARWEEYQLTKNPECPICEDKQSFDELNRPKKACHLPTTAEITPKELQTLMNDHEPFFLLDVREQEEYNNAHMNGHLIPLAELPARLIELDKNQVIVVHCHAGVRSMRALEFLVSQGFSKVYSLQGGIVAWYDFLHQAP
jgi:molybdopterin/thiamine biosynthesis adenylyltransferase/rhodanese-related sulfurtransferase